MTSSGDSATFSPMKLICTPLAPPLAPPPSHCPPGRLPTKAVNPERMDLLMADCHLMITVIVFRHLHHSVFFLNIIIGMGGRSMGTGFFDLRRPMRLGAESINASAHSIKSQKTNLPQSNGLIRERLNHYSLAGIAAH